ncbi:unnamed protein product, partial [Didymodactylos carnosus]
MVSSRVGF